MILIFCNMWGKEIMIKLGLILKYKIGGRFGNVIFDVIMDMREREKK